MAMGNSKGIVKRLAIETIDATKYLIIGMSSTTIEKVFKYNLVE